MKTLFEWLLAKDPEYNVLDVAHDSPLKKSLDLIEEGVWKESQKSGWSFRVDSANPDLKIRRHVHVAKDKHINAKQAAGVE